MSESNASQISVSASEPASPDLRRAKGGEMPEEELLVLIRQYEMASLGSSVAAGATISTTIYPSNQTMTTLEIDRYAALNAYFARPLGNEVENRSQVVLPELRDTIEWIMPQLMRMFCGSKTICRFDPETQADEAQAEQETLAVNHIFMQENNGFFILQDFFKDAMLMRNGYADVEWCEEQQVSEERYSGLTEFDLTQLLQDDDEKVQVLEHREYTGNIAGQPIRLFDLKIRRKGKVGRVNVQCIPPEEMRVTPRARAGMDDLGYASHIVNKTRSDLIAEGFDKDIVNTAATGRPNWLEIDALARNQVVDQLSVENPSDRAMQELEVRKVIMKVDFDGDGIAEMRRIYVIGDKIADNEVIAETPFASCVPKRMPHRHTGISLYDEIMDIQVIKTNLWRQGLDNLTIANNQRVAVDWKNANFDDLLTSRPGGVVRGNGPPQSWIMPIEQPSNLVEQVIPALNYLDEQKASRTGIGPGSMPVDPDELQDVTKGAHAANMQAAALKVEMLARLLAEGVKDIFRKIHSTLIRHQDKPMWLQVSGKWMQVDPTQWRRRTRVTVNVGLGSGNRDEMRQNIQMLAAAQGNLAQLGLVGPKQAYESFKVLCEALAFNTPERFAMDPASPEFKQHQAEMQHAQASMPQPQVQSAQIKAQTTLGQEQAENARLMLKLASEKQAGNNQLVHEMFQQQNSQRHENTQNAHQSNADMVSAHKDREVQLDQQHLQIILKLIPAIAQIIAAEKKDVAELGSDVSSAGASIQ